jgi:hypothetical protein
VDRRSGETRGQHGKMRFLPAFKSAIFLSVSRSIPILPSSPPSLSLGSPSLLESVTLPDPNPTPHSEPIRVTNRFQLVPIVSSPIVCSFSVFVTLSFSSSPFLPDWSLPRDRATPSQLVPTCQHLSLVSASLRLSFVGGILQVLSLSVICEFLLSLSHRYTH